jgi:hypothetical protein
LQVDIDGERGQAQEGTILNEGHDQGATAVDTFGGLSFAHFPENHQDFIGGASLETGGKEDEQGKQDDGQSDDGEDEKKTWHGEWGSFLNQKQIGRDLNANKDNAAVVWIKGFAEKISKSFLFL